MYTFLVIIPSTIQHDSYSHSIYIVLCIISNLETTGCTQVVCECSAISCKGLEHSQGIPPWVPKDDFVLKIKGILHI